MQYKLNICVLSGTFIFLKKEKPKQTLLILSPQNHSQLF